MSAVAAWRIALVHHLTTNTHSRVRALTPALRARAGQAEQDRCVPSETIDDFRATGMFRLLQPKIFEHLADGRAGAGRQTGGRVADPTIQTHVIEIEAEGAFGRFTFTEDVAPSRDNPKTGEIVALAMIKTIRQLASPVVIGG